MPSNPSTLGVMGQRLDQWTGAGLRDQSIDRSDALSILEDPAWNAQLLPLLHAAGQVRRHYFDNRVTIHVLDNVQNGACPEDCGYCGQSSVTDAPIKAYKIKPVEQILTEAAEAKERGAWRFCMVLSGRGPDDRDIHHMCSAIEQVKAMGLRTCLSAGLLDDDKARKLKAAGLDRLNHNLNTSERHYPSVCSTHTFNDRLQTLLAARRAGIGLCSGLIVGLGEAHDDLVQVAYALRELKAESIPVNFLLPIDGNPIHAHQSNQRPINPLYVLRVLAMFRFVNPTAEIRIAAGREFHLRSLQPLALWPANSLFMDGYLLTEGQGVSDTLAMILDAGFDIQLDGAWPAELRQTVDQYLAGHGGATSLASNGAAGSGVTLKPAVRKPTAEPFVPLTSVGKPRSV